MRSLNAECLSPWQAIVAMVQQAVSYLNDIPDLDTRNELAETLNNVSSSKVPFFTLVPLWRWSTCQDRECCRCFVYVCWCCDSVGWLQDVYSPHRYYHAGLAKFVLVLALDSNESLSSRSKSQLVDLNLSGLDLSRYDCPFAPQIAFNIH